MALMIGLYGNRMVDIESLRHGDIDIFDIGWALAQNLRFNGHSRIPYSVAEHCVALSCVVPHELQFAALMHDASEAYIGDIIAPLKQTLPALVELENQIHRTIFDKFNIDFRLMDKVKPWDWQMCRTEAHLLMGDPDWAQDPAAGFLPINIGRELPAWRRRAMFFSRYEYLTGDTVAMPEDARAFPGVPNDQAARHPWHWHPAHHRPRDLYSRWPAIQARRHSRGDHV